MGKALERADCGQVSVDVLSERDESKNGCVYSILLRQRDSSGTTSRAVFQVTVLPNQKLWRFGTLQLSRSSATVREVSWCPRVHRACGPIGFLAVGIRPLRRCSRAGARFFNPMAGIN